MQALLRGRGRSRLLPSWTQLRPVASRGGRAGAVGCAIVVLAALCVSCEASVDAPEDIGTSSSALAVAGLFPTGVNAMGARLAVGAIDPHYVLSSTDANFPGPDALTVTPAGGWAAAGANSRWISIRATTNGAMGGVYTYTTTFTLAGVDPATATLSGRWACDDSCVLRLNGTQVATDPTPAWPLAANFAVPVGSPFKVGVNTLAFVTTNATGGPTGLQVLSVTGTVSGCSADDQCSAAQYCNTQSATCTAKLANGSPIPTVTGHTPPLTGVCTAGAGTAVCTSAVCDTRDNECGLANGDGACTPADAATVCRSGACSATGKCVVPGGCNVDGDCTGGDWCDEATHACKAKLANGSPIPSDPAHTAPILNGSCTTAAAMLVCASAVCDAADNECGIADGHGPCTAGDGATVCRSGTCGAGGECGGGAPDAGADAGGRDAGADAGEREDAGADAGEREDAGADADAGAGVGADAGAEAGGSEDAGEDAATGDANGGADSGANADASAGEDAEADGSEDASVEDATNGTEGDDSGLPQGGSLQGGGISCGMARSGSSDPGGAALWMMGLAFAAAAGRGRRRR